jgi:rare lipoprotein A
LIWLALFGCRSATSPPPGRSEPPPARVPGQPKPYRVNGIWYQPIPDAHGFKQRGTASWYGKKFHGRRTSNGETYNMYGISAAHKTLPFGTMVRVTNLENGRRLDIRINDRGPFAKGRIIDLSYGAAEKLGVVGPGTAPVEIVALAAPTRSVSQTGGVRRFEEVDLTRGNFTFQVGAFQDQANARRLAAKLKQHHNNVHIASYDRGDGLFHRVRVGRAHQLEEAEAYERTLMQQGYDVFIVAE